MRTPRNHLLVSAGVLAALVLAGCGSSATEKTADRPESTTITIATHDSWAMSKEVMAAFTKQTGITVKIQKNDDAGALTNKLVLTKGRPIADGVFGIDNTFATRAVDEGVLAPYTPAARPPSLTHFDLAGDGSRFLTPIDYGDVCMNTDDTWFAEKKLPVPTTLDDLTKPAYRDLLVVPGATASSPGMAFLLTTIAKYGDGWKAYWQKLIDNGVKIDAGWSDAYFVDFTAGGGKGDRPIVLSYSSSPPDSVPPGGTEPRTSAMLDTCFRQVEYAGVLAGAKNPKNAAKFIDFMLTRTFQVELPGQMYVYPVLAGVPLPKNWASWAPLSPKPYFVAPTDITAHRSEWLREWRDLTTR